MSLKKLLPLVGLLGFGISGAFVPVQAQDGNRDTEPKFTAGQLEFFEKQVRPLLAEHCYQCHSANAKRLEAGLFLDRRSAILKGGDSGPAVVPGDPDASLLIESIRYESYEMPPKGKLKDKEIQTFVRWIEMGAPWPKEAPPVASENNNGFDLQARKAEYWVWQPVQNPVIPDVGNSAWPRNELDHFILARLEKEGLKPAKDIGRNGLLRRVYMDLIGLPPTPAEIKAFEADGEPGAIERVVDRLLNSKNFGERWGRHWLDLVRYAESRGHEFDNDTPNAFQYRDYVIRALNADVPYDQFVREHIAGDLLPSPRLNPEKGFNESVLGTGFWFLGEWVHSPVDIRKDEADRFDNMLDVMSKTFLGATVACARCHDHKFDAISSADYYSLSGFLQSSDYRQVRFESMENNRQVAQALDAVDKKYRKQVETFLSQRNINRPAFTDPLKDDSILFDFARMRPEEFMQDGFIFGSQPRQAADIYFDGGHTGRIEVLRYGAAVNDSIWNGLESVTLGSIRNRSQLAKLPRSGRTLRTPTFDLKQGTVSCLVDGSGYVVACVDSHRLVAGPLHKETIRTIKPGERWVTMNLKRYVGHRIHLEFTPAVNSRLSVRLVTQGLDQAGLTKIDKQLDAMDKRVAAYADRVESLFASTRNVATTVFADFESGDYGQWTATGDAFGRRPQTQETVADYQGNVGAKGRFFVNSHNIHAKEKGRKGDAATGRLTSPEFRIEFDRIRFLIGGGSHTGKTCVNLVIDGKPVLSATGKNSNRMQETVWDVSRFSGKNARIEVVDEYRKGWGNIGFDHVVFEKDLVEALVERQAAMILGKWRRERADLESRIVRRSQLAPAMMDGSGEDDRILIRGNASKPGKVVPRHFLTAVSGDAPMEIEHGSGRLQLAEQIVDPSNPLTYRVIVNRIWHHLMGRGIVPTVDDFGFLGQRPTHPKLLDHLAQRFVADGRSLKKMIKYIVLSRTYRMSGVAEPSALEADPGNLLWHYRPPRRLEGEAIRDSLLAISGRLNPESFGPPVPIHLTSFMDGRGRPGVNGPLDGNGRRSIYIAVRRNFLSPFMLTFDMPVPFSSMGRRNVSNVPAQALILLNDPLVVDLAKSWGRRALKQIPGNDPESTRKRIEWMYLTGFARRPTDEEMKVAFAFLDPSSSLRKDASPEKAWTDFAHILVNTKEFIFIR